MQSDYAIPRSIKYTSNPNETDVDILRKQARMHILDHTSIPSTVFGS